MQFEAIFDHERVILPKMELDITLHQSVGIITDLKRKQLLMEQLNNHVQYYLFRAGQSEYMRLSVNELLHFLNEITEKNEHIPTLIDYFDLKKEQKLKIKNLSPSKKTYVTLLRLFFAHQPILVIEEPYFYLEEQERRHFKRILDDLSKEKQILILTSNLEDALISCDVIYRLNDSGFYPLDLQDSEEDKQDGHKQSEPNITMLKISTKKNDKVILFNPPEIDFIESSNGSIFVHVGGENYECVLTLTELEQRLSNFGFFRCHRSYIVNLQKVREIITWTKNSYSLRLTTGKDAVVPLSRTKLPELKALLNL